ncbi:MAG: alpha/beta hydrolase [Chlorobi bacterium]|nr:alpha/beta hydrolase [Chlorobiota bacterium]
MWDSYLKEENGFKYIETGDGPPMVILHGIMGGLSNFNDVIDHFRRFFRIYMPELPVYSFPLLKTNIKGFSKFLYDFLKFKNIRFPVLLGNSLGGHVALYYTHLHPDRVRALVLTGSSGLYEKGFGESFPQRKNYDYIKRKTQEVFHDPKMATKELVDEVFRIVNNRGKILRTLALAKSAIRHNMAKDLHKIRVPACLIWGKQDVVTPPRVAEEFLRLLPDADLFWIDRAGHAPMMEQPEQFNDILENWLRKRGILPRREEPPAPSDETHKKGVARRTTPSHDS